jgi:hypothetical protein
METGGEGGMNARLVEIIVLEEEIISSLRPGAGYEDGDLQALGGLAGYDFDAWESQRVPWTTNRAAGNSRRSSTQQRLDLREKFG